MSTTTAKKTEVSVYESGIADVKETVAYTTKAQIEASEKAAKAAKDLVEFNRASVDAFAEASKILAAGSIDLLNQMGTTSQAALAETLSGLRSLVVAKTAKERFELQASLARATASWTLTETSRFAKASLALSEQASAPIIARLVHASEAFSALAA